MERIKESLLFNCKYIFPMAIFKKSLRIKSRPLCDRVESPLRSVQPAVQRSHTSPGEFVLETCQAASWSEAVGANASTWYVVATT
jgi:hypothetical protein